MYIPFFQVGDSDLQVTSESFLNDLREKHSQGEHDKNWVNLNCRKLVIFLKNTWKFEHRRSYRVRKCPRPAPGASLYDLLWRPSLLVTFFSAHSESGNACT